MNLQLINEVITQYKTALTQRDDDQWLFPWRAMHRFDYHWDLDTRDLATMYEDSFGGDCILWEDRDYHPKTSMLHYIKENPELVRSMFVDLFYESRDVIGRVHRFIDQCDQLRQYHSKGITKRESHYHGDRRMVMIYLAFRYPTVYTLYHEPGFQAFMSAVKAKPLGGTVPLERYIKTARTIGKLMKKDEELVQLFKDRTTPSDLYDQENLLMVVDLYAFMS